MKIVIDSRILYTSTGRYVERLLHHLQQIDNQNQYIVLLLAKDFGRWQPISANFTKVIADYRPYTIREQLHFAWQLYRLHPDLVHFTMPQQPLLHFGRKVTTVHDLTLVDFINKRRLGLLKDLYKNNFKPTIFKIVIWAFVHSSREIITPTKYIRDQVHKRFHLDQSRITVTPESAEATVPEAQVYSPLLNQKFILYVGNAYPYKNLERLVQAFAELGRPKYKLVLVGKTDFFYEQLAKYVQENGIKNVIFTGFAGDGQLAWLYQNAACYAFPSLSEGFGLPGLEAMLYGLPVASSNASCLPEVYGDAAHYFDPHDPADIAKAITDVLDQPELRKHLVSAGHERLKLYSWRRMAEETLAVYQKALR